MPSEVVIEKDDCVDLAEALAIVIVPALEAYKVQERHGVWSDAFNQACRELGIDPNDSSHTHQEWERICKRGRAIMHAWLDEMIYAFTFVRDGESGFDERPAQVQAGIDLFAKHFQHLWI